jgi:nucleoside-diphosphate-sugar epimerase
LLNVDIAPPKIEVQVPYWRQCNILDANRLYGLFAEFRPSHVVHLAARATTEGKTLADFVDNTVGTANVLEATKRTPSVARVVIASSQHVRKPGAGLAERDDDYAPLGLYGASKVTTEKLAREARLTCVWTIIRPTTVWGPWHPFLPGGLWHWMKSGWYVHPQGDRVVRSYGYVENVVWQINRILEAESSLVDGKVYYVGEECVKQLDWINAFSRALRGRDVRKVPREWIHLLAWIGDALRTFHLRLPMDGPRYFNLTTTNPVPIRPTIEAFGIPPYSLDLGIQETVKWLDECFYA